MEEIEKSGGGSGEGCGERERLPAQYSGANYQRERAGQLSK